MTPFEPERPDYVEAVHALHAEVPLSVTLGIAVTAVKPGEISAELKLTPKVTQQSGVAHAGAITALADTVCGLAAYSLMPAGVDVLSVNINVSLIRPGVGARLRAVGRVIKAGTRIYFTEAEVFAGDGLKESGEKLAAKVSAVMTAV